MQARAQQEQRNELEAEGVAAGAAGRKGAPVHLDRRPDVRGTREQLHALRRDGGRAGSGTSAAPRTGVVFAELADVERIRDEILEAIAEAAATKAPALLDRRELAKALGVCADTVDKLRKDGLPTIMVVDSPRFDLTDCLVWLKARRG